MTNQPLFEIQDTSNTAKNMWKPIPFSINCFRIFPASSLNWLDNQPLLLAATIHFFRSQTTCLSFDGLFLCCWFPWTANLFCRGAVKKKVLHRLFAEIFLYFYHQYDHDNEWVAIVIYRRRSIRNTTYLVSRVNTAAGVQNLPWWNWEASQQFIGVGIVR